MLHEKGGVQNWKAGLFLGAPNAHVARFFWSGVVGRLCLAGLLAGLSKPAIARPPEWKAGGQVQL